MAGYVLIASETTVQQLAPTVSLDVVYCTIQTSPSSVIASLPVPLAEFNAGTAGPVLSSYANDIEELRNYQNVIAAQGGQTIDVTGYIADHVKFYVQYVPAGGPAAAITAEAVVPSTLLSEGGDPAIESVLLAEAKKIIDGVYQNLVSTAGG